jgi:methylated-DNA-protein-cysteine methyltransferase-like protein
MREAVYRVVSQIPRGKVLTYGRIARIIGKPGAARAVGRILHHNPDPKSVPCHRVVDRLGCIAAGYRFGGPRAQRELLIEEGVPFRFDGHVDLERCLWELDNQK